MKASWFWVLISMAIALVLLSFSSSRPSSSLSDTLFTRHVGGVTQRATGRKLKVQEMRYKRGGVEKKKAGDVNLEDYRPIDPSPNSNKATIKPAPVEHGTPLIPYIPKASPPSNPPHGE